ncbi:SMP-30/gluconolactonase/LRE family protein [uncultured Paraglaciecola sp.]|uniref:SMP-30/gluconolactonase/LRE family protein n=1 Tax=uncultured Paraglaciecola sp. TaxID=1765024 RepID=UPI0030DBCF5C
MTKFKVMTLNDLKLTIPLLFASFITNVSAAADVDQSTKANGAYCAPGSEQVQLDLSNVSLTREQGIPLIYQGMNNIEGPLWHDGALYYSNLGSHQANDQDFVLSNQSTIWRWVPGTKPEVWLDDTVAGTNGLAIDNNGNLVATRQLDGSVVYIDWQTKKVSPIVTRYEDKRFNSPNDLTIADDNTIYFTDPNWNTPSNIDPANTQGGGAPGSQVPGQRIYRVSADGKVNPTLVTELVPALRDKPNGITLSLDQKQLIVGGIAGLWAFELKSGRVSNPKQLLNTPIDGLGKDCSGNIYVTTTRNSPTRTDDQLVVILNKNYDEIGTLTVPEIHIVTNIAFGGEDGRTLYVTGLTAPMDGNKVRQCGNADCLPAGIYRARLNVQGFPY